MKNNEKQTMLELLKYFQEWQKRRQALIKIYIIAGITILVAALAPMIDDLGSNISLFQSHAPRTDALLAFLKKMHKYQPDASTINEANITIMRPALAAAENKKTTVLKTAIRKFLKETRLNLLDLEYELGMGLDPAMKKFLEYRREYIARTEEKAGSSIKAAISLLYFCNLLYAGKINAENIKNPSKEEQKTEARKLILMLNQNEKKSLPFGLKLKTIKRA